jgi:hypothetical protein
LDSPGLGSPIARHLLNHPANEAVDQSRAIWFPITLPFVIMGMMTGEDKSTNLYVSV